MQVGKVLIIIGISFIFLGILWLYFPKTIQWVGRLPGDFHWKSGSSGFYFPLATCLLISLIFSILTWLLRR